MVVVHSASKGLAAMVMALAHSRGWLDYDERVARYWPEFAQNGKERITVRQLLAHQAGLFAFDEPVDRDVVADLDRLAGVMARQRPAWEPGERQAYHAITLGFYESELLRRVDPAHRTVGQFFAEEIAAPLGIDFFLRLPESIPNDRLAPLYAAGRWKAMLRMPPRIVLAAMRRRSVLYRSLIANPGTGFYVDPQRIYARELEAPSGMGVGNARAIAPPHTRCRPPRLWRASPQQIHRPSRDDRCRSTHRPPTAAEGPAQAARVAQQTPRRETRARHDDAECRLTAP
jgi:CubicO group peptidase (beta-lactamase class C family)